MVGGGRHSDERQYRHPSLASKVIGSVRGCAEGTRAGRGIDLDINTCS